MRLAEKPVLKVKAMGILLFAHDVECTERRISERTNLCVDSAKILKKNKVGEKGTKG